MLRIRISGSKRELSQIAHKAGNAQIKRFKRDKGKTAYAIDVEISVEDFLENLDLGDSEKETTLDSDADKKNNCDPQEIQAELEQLLNDMQD